MSSARSNGSPTVLDRIVADKRARLARGEFARATASGGSPEGSRFVAALRGPSPAIVAEIKARSPSAGEIVASAEGKVETIALAYRRGHAAALSIVVEQDHFGGRPEWLPRARRISGLPVLFKDFIVDERQLDFAVGLGADAVLLIVRILKGAELEALREGAFARGLAVVAEVHNEAEIARAADAEPDVIGVNARNLATFATEVGRAEKLAARLPAGPVRLAESGIRDRADVSRLSAAGYDAFLVGEALLRADDPEQALRDLRS